MKKIIATVGAAMTAVTLCAADANEAAEVEQEDTQLFEAGFDVDFLSAYIWHNAIQNDRPVLQPCVWADFTGIEDFYFGFYIFQNYDLTNRRDYDLHAGLNETDYGLHVGYTPWTSDDEQQNLTFELGHEWFVNERVHSSEKYNWADLHELYLKATYENPIVNTYGLVAWEYDSDFGARSSSAFYYELGFNREFELYETLTLGADWNVNFGNGTYLRYLYTGTGPDYEDKPTGGIGGTTFKLYLAWDITDWMQLVGTVAYTGILNDSIRDSFDEQGSEGWYHDDRYSRDLCWGGISLKFSY